MNVDSTPQFVEEAYKKMERKLEVVRSRFNRPLTLAEKLLLRSEEHTSELQSRRNLVCRLLLEKKKKIKEKKTRKKKKKNC